MFVGDLLHSPMQLPHSEYRCSFDLDPAQARATRRDVLSRAAHEAAVVLPAHLPGHGSAKIIATHGEHAYDIASWADFPAHHDL